MNGNIFINYRREDSSHVAGRLHDSLAPNFGHDKLFMDVDNIPVGRDFEEYLKSQVAACDAMLAIIGPNWLTAKDETGQRRLDNPNDFIVIEIGAALARKIPVVPVLVDGALMPKASELPESLSPLARRQAVQVRHTSFRSDAEALVKRLREALGYDLSERRWRMRAIVGAAALTVLLLIGWSGYGYFRDGVERRAQQSEVQRLFREAEEIRKAIDAEANRKAEADRQRKEGEAAGRTGNYDRAVMNFNEAIRLNPNDAMAYYDRGLAYSHKDDQDRSIADYSEAIRLNPVFSMAFNARGNVYAKKGDFDRAMADFDEAIRLNPMYHIAFSNRANVYERKGDLDRAMADVNEAIRINPLYSLAFNNRGYVYVKRGDYNRAMADYNEAIRLDPKYALAFCNRGMLKRKIDDSSGNADIAESRQLDPSGCRSP
jgi:tetratricopeptide (TPR) repeat protein